MWQSDKPLHKNSIMLKCGNVINFYTMIQACWNVANTLPSTQRLKIFEIGPMRQSFTQGFKHAEMWQCDKLLHIDSSMLNYGKYPTLNSNTLEFWNRANEILSYTRIQAC